MPAGFAGRESLTVHVIGASMGGSRAQSAPFLSPHTTLHFSLLTPRPSANPLPPGFELAFLPKFEELLHLTPALTRLELVFVGPEITLTYPQEVDYDDCPACRAAGKRLRVFFSPRTYHGFIADEAKGRARLAAARAARSELAPSESTTPTDIPEPVFGAHKLHTATELGYRPPDLLVAFNAGLHMFKKGKGAAPAFSPAAAASPAGGDGANEGAAKEGGAASASSSSSAGGIASRSGGGADSWHETLSLIFPPPPAPPLRVAPQFGGLYAETAGLDGGGAGRSVPLLVTAYSKDEVILSAARVESYGARFPLPPRANPFAR